MVDAVPRAFRARERRPAIVGHRGVRGPRPENTLAAFEEAIRQGADAIELDVRPCRTGEVVVLHDPDLARVAGDPRHAAELSLAELRTIDVGQGERAPTLLDALALARDAGVGVNVELKYDVPSKREAVLAFARALRRWDPRHDLVISCFDPWILAAHRALVPSRLHAQLVHASDYHDWALRLGRVLRFPGTHLEAKLGTPSRVALLRGRGYVAAWTVNDPAEARALFARGVASIITDAPAKILAAFEPSATT